MSLGVTPITKYMRRKDIFGKILGLGLGLITGQKKRPAQPEGRSRTGKYLEGA